ncbi:hypothetical protein C8R44DRAFT_734986 [Mycena epipterygia]|nr:hypothetical protein C8R44DRAFT_734986 [Mycena epipterygia]
MLRVKIPCKVGESEIPRKVDGDQNPRKVATTKKKPDSVDGYERPVVVQGLQCSRDIQLELGKRMCYLREVIRGPNGIDGVCDDCLHLTIDLISEDGKFGKEEHFYFAWVLIAVNFARNFGLADFARDFDPQHCAFAGSAEFPQWRKYQFGRTVTAERGSIARSPQPRRGARRKSRKAGSVFSEAATQLKTTANQSADYISQKRTFAMVISMNMVFLGQATPSSLGRRFASTSSHGVGLHPQLLNVERGFNFLVARQFPARRMFGGHEARSVNAHFDTFVLELNLPDQRLLCGHQAIISNSD